MIDPKNFKYQDRPIETEVEDALDRAPFIESLERSLLREERDGNGKIISVTATGYVVGLVGRWGLGKSSILNLLFRRLRKKPRVAVVMFNPWLFKGRDELLRAFFNSMREALGRSKIEHVEDLSSALDEYWAALDWLGKAGAAVGDAHGGGGALSAGWNWLTGLGRTLVRKAEVKSVDTERERLQEKIAKHKAALVILIDELDRVEDEDVRSVAQLIKALGDIKGISYLVAYDQDRVVMALGRGNAKERTVSGAAYLEKIIQHPIPLRPLFADDVEALLNDALANHALDLRANEDEAATKIYEQLKAEITTPREVKRLIGSYAVLEQAVRGEIRPIDILAYCWILTKSPKLREAIASNIDKVVDDPTSDEMTERIVARMGKERTTAVDVLGEAAQGHDRILAMLFPVFGARSRSEADDGTVLSQRRNLVRLLYLGNPPGMVRRTDIERIWSEANENVVAHQLQHLFDQGRLRALIDRLDDLLPSLPESGDVQFWSSLAPLLKRPQDWATGPDDRSNIADEAVGAILRMGRLAPTNKARVMATIDALIAKDDLAIAPRFLRKQLFANGLTRHDTSSYGRGILNREETEELFSREHPRYVAAVKDGSLLKRAVNSEGIYALANRRLWTDELRAALTLQLDSLEAIGTLATLITPPGYLTDRANLDELFDTDAVSLKIDTFIAANSEPDDPWVRQSLKRFKAILDRRDPDFD